MTAPNLPVTLARLAQLLPERVRAEMAGDESEAWVYRYEARRRGWHTVWWGGDRPAPHNIDALEMALREECDARGWHWQVGAGRSEVGDWDRRRVTVGWHDLPGGTPAYALAVAVLRWIEREALREGP